MVEPTRYFFVHLQKTGGTALFQRLREHFGSPAVYPTPEDHGNVRAVTEVAHLVERFRAQRDTIQVVTGHFPLCMVDVLDAPFTTFTILRDPVERTLSLLRRRKVAEDRFHGVPLETIYEHPELEPIIRNHMVKMLSLTPDEMGPTPLTTRVTFDAARLERAKHNLATIDVVGLQEEFDEACAELSRRFGWDLGPPRFANRTAREPVADALRERIAADNAHDVELHRFAVDLVAQRQAQGDAVHG